MRLRTRIFRSFLLWSSALVVIAIVVVATVLESGVLTPRIVAYVNSKLVDSAELQVSAGAIHWRPWSGLVLQEVLLSIPKEFTPGRTRSERFSLDRGYVLSIRRVEIGYRFAGVLSGSPVIQRVRVIRPEFDLAELSRWNARLTEVRGDAAGDELRGIRDEGFASSFSIRNLQIEDGRVKGGGEFRLAELHLGGSLDGDDGVWRLVVDEAGGRVQTDNLSEDVDMTGAIGLVEGALILEGLHLAAAGGRVSFEGRLDPWGPTKSNLLTAGYAIPLEQVGQWIGQDHPLLTGNLEFRFRTSGRPDSLALKGSLRSRDATGIGRDARFDLHRRGNRFGVESLRLTVGESRFDFKGELVASDPVAVDGVAVFGNLDPALLLAEEDFRVMQSLEGAARFEGTGLTRDTFDGSAEVVLKGGSILGFEFDTANVRARLKDSELVVSGMRVKKGSSELEGIGSIDAENQVVAEFQGDITDLHDVGEIAEQALGPISGQAAARVRILGPLTGPSLESTLSFEDATVLGASAQTLEVEIETERLAANSRFTVAASGTRIGYGETVLREGTANGTWESGAVRVSSLNLKSERRGELRLAGDLDVSPEVGLAGQIVTLDVRSPKGDVQWTNQNPIRISRDNDGLSFRGLDLRSGSGRVRGDVSFEPNGTTFVEASGSGVDLEVFSPFLILPRRLGGSLEFEANAIVGPDTLAADVQLTLDEGRYGTDRLQRAQGRLEIRDDRVVFDDLYLESSFATASLNGDLTLDRGTFREVLADSASRKRILDLVEFENLRADLDCPDLTRLEEFKPSRWWVGGHARVQARVDGAANRPSVDLTAHVENGRLGSEPLTRFEGTGRLHEGVLTFENCEIVSGEGVILANGYMPLDWSLADPHPRMPYGPAMDLGFEAESFPSRGLVYLVQLFEMTEGKVHANGRLAGVRDALYLEGDFVGEEGVVTIPTFDNPLIQGNIVGSFDRDGLTVSSAHFQDGAGGEVSGGGRLVLVNLKPVSSDLKIHGREYHYAGVLGIRGVGDGTVTMALRESSGGQLMPYFHGKMNVARADLDERVLLTPEERADMPEMPVGVTIPEEPTAPTEPVEPLTGPLLPFLCDIDFEADNNVWLKKDDSKVEIAGAVTFHVTEDYFGLSGSARSLRGNYSVLNTKFDLEKAEVEFYDPSDPQSAYIDAEATCRVLDEDVTVFVTGTLGDPIIESTTESGMTEAEIWELLALRIKRTDATGAGETTPSDASVVSRALLESWGQLLANRFGQQISQELFLDTIDLEVEGPSTRVGIGKRLGPDVFVRYTHEVSSEDGSNDQASDVASSLEGPEQQLLLEYRLSEIFQLQGETGRIDGEDYLNVDLWAEWGY